MHQDIEKLLSTAKEKGSITEKQREIILNKAQQLGEDMAEVEFMLEDITLRREELKKTKFKRCPNCGATVDDLALKCPECGHVFSDESEANRDVNKIIAEFEKKFQTIQNTDRQKVLKQLNSSRSKDDPAENIDVDLEIEKRMNTAIREFKVPYTQNALIQGFEYAYGQYESWKGDDFGFAGVWLGKAKELYRLILSQPNKDAETKVWLDNHKKVLKALPFPKWILAMIAGIVLVAVLAAIYVK
jgi:uncharacterized C2H2 Zn-finger protein